MAGQYWASACFLVFAAGQPKFASVHARIGVHSASDAAGSDTAASRAYTTSVARYAAALGVPPMILGRMVTTLPGAMAWLTAGELRAMGVMLVGDAPTGADAPGTPLQPGSAPAASAAPVARAPEPAPAPAPAPNPSFARGLADRTHYEQWFATLSGDVRAGAAYWAENRSLTHRGQTVSCSPAGASAAWARGCLWARQALDPTDAARLADPEYRRGWNAY